MSDQSITLESLPNEILEHLTSFLLPDSWFNLAKVSTRFSSILSGENSALWKRLTLDLFSTPSENGKELVMKHWQTLEKIRSKDPDQVVLWAILQGFEELAICLYKEKKEKDPLNWLPEALIYSHLFVAAKKGCARVVDFICSQDWEMERKVWNHHPLEIAIQYGHAPIVIRLLRKVSEKKKLDGGWLEFIGRAYSSILRVHRRSANGDTEKQTATELFVQCVEAFPSFIRDIHASEAVRYDRPFNVALQCGNLEAVKLMLEKGYIDLSKIHDGPQVFGSAMTGSVHVLRFILEFNSKLPENERIDIDKPNRQGNTLMASSTKTWKDKLEMMKLPIEFGADVNKPSGSRNETPFSSLLRTLHERYKACVEFFLFETKADPSIVNNKGENGLHAMAAGISPWANGKSQFLDTLRLLRDEMKKRNDKNGIDLWTVMCGTKDDAGNTPYDVFEKKLANSSNNAIKQMLKECSEMVKVSK